MKPKLISLISALILLFPAIVTAEPVFDSPEWASLFSGKQTKSLPADLPTGKGAVSALSNHHILIKQLPGTKNHKQRFSAINYIDRPTDLRKHPGILLSAPAIQNEMVYAGQTVVDFIEATLSNARKLSGNPNWQLPLQALEFPQLPYPEPAYPTSGPLIVNLGVFIRSNGQTTPLSLPSFCADKVNEDAKADELYALERTVFDAFAKNVKNKSDELSAMDELTLIKTLSHFHALLWNSFSKKAENTRQKSAEDEQNFGEFWDGKMNTVEESKPSLLTKKTHPHSDASDRAKEKRKAAHQKRMEENQKRREALEQMTPEERREERERLREARMNDPKYQDPKYQEELDARRLGLTDKHDGFKSHEITQAKIEKQHEERMNDPKYQEEREARKKAAEERREEQKEARKKAVEEQREERKKARQNADKKPKKTKEENRKAALERCQQLGSLELDLAATWTIFEAALTQSAAPVAQIIMPQEIAQQLSDYAKKAGRPPQIIQLFMALQQNDLYQIQIVLGCSVRDRFLGCMNPENAVISNETEVVKIADLLSKLIANAEPKRKYEILQLIAAANPQNYNVPVKLDFLKEDIPGVLAADRDLLLKKLRHEPIDTSPKKKKEKQDDKGQKAGK